MNDMKMSSLDAGLFASQAGRTQNSLNAATTAAGAADGSDEKLKEASQQFESLLLNFMIREMRATVPEGSLFPKSMAEEMFTGMLDEKIAGEMADQGGIGISRLIFDQLKGK